MPGFQPRHDTDPVWFGDQQVNNLLVASQQTGVRITAIHGWDDRPDVRDVRELRSGQVGEYADNLYLGGRTITVEGEVYGSSWSDMQARKRALAALFQPSSTESVLKIPDPSVASPGTVWSASGMTGYERSSLRVVEAIQFGDTLDPACQVWQVILRASDPRVYSDVETSTDSGTSGTDARTVTVDQGGSYETPPTLTVTGPTGSEWSVSEPDSGLSLTFAGLTMAASDVMHLNTSDRTATYSSTYESVRLVSSDLSALWMLDETSGTTADNAEGTSATDGTYAGGYTLNQAGPSAGIASIALNGSTGYVAVPHDASLVSSSLAIEAWVKFDSVVGSHVIVDKTDTAVGGYRVTMASGSFDVVITNGAASYVIQTSAFGRTYVAGVWYHLVVSLNAASGVCTTYVNGEYAASGAASIASSSVSLNIGRRRDGATNYMDGNVAAVAFFASNKSPSEALALYEASVAAASISGYSYLIANTSRWANLGTGSSVYTLASSGLNTGSKLNVSYRDARL